MLTSATSVPAGATSEQPLAQCIGPKEVPAPDSKQYLPIKRNSNFVRPTANTRANLPCARVRQKASDLGKARATTTMFQQKHAPGTGGEEQMGFGRPAGVACFATSSLHKKTKLTSVRKPCTPLEDGNRPQAMRIIENDVAIGRPAIFLGRGRPELSHCWHASVLEWCDSCLDHPNPTTTVRNLAKIFQRYIEHMNCPATLGLQLFCCMGSCGKVSSGFVPPCWPEACPCSSAWCSPGAGGQHTCLLPN